MGFFMDRFNLSQSARTIVNHNWRSLAIRKIAEIGIVIDKQSKNKVLRAYILRYKIKVPDIEDMLAQEEQRIESLTKEKKPYVKPKDEVNKSIKPVCYNQNSKKSEEINKDNFYDTWAWKDIRYQALDKCGRRCMSCGASPLKDNKVVLHVDHIKPFRKYPELALDINNLQVLCEDCNMGKGYWDETDFRTRAG